MGPMEARLNTKRIIACLALTAVFDTVISLFLTSLGFGGGLFHNFILSQSIGLCMCSFILAGHRFVRGPSVPGHMLMLLIAMPTGAAAGALIGTLIAGYSLAEVFRGRPAMFIQMLFVGILFGTIITYFFFSRERISHAEAELREEQIRVLTLEKKGLETHLRLLQAQIEPHFLFNSLSNILSLLETEPAKGKGMLVDLTRYLRVSLSRTREKTATLGQEMELVKAYLDIQKVRMGDRLHYDIDIPDRMTSVPFPPVLVQPLVENAVKHGLEPQIDGGAISIRVDAGSESLRLVVADTGCGLAEDAGTGIGLANVRERLEALYNGKGRLTLEENRPSGLKVTMVIPYEGMEGDHRG
jgi:sensor histidine kinase YesM